MKYRTLGKTNLIVSEVGFGGIPIQRVSQKEANDLIVSLNKNGINFIDTARGYTCSEEYIGKALKETNLRSEFYLATKSMARTYEAMTNDINASLTNLQTDVIDLYQIHNLSSKKDYETLMGKNGAYKALLEAKAAGKIKNIGLTSHSLDFVKTIIDNYPFDTLQFPYNIIERDIEEVFEKAKEKNIGVIVMKPLAGGAIDNARVALKFILNNPNVSVAIPGMAMIAEAEQNASITAGEYNETENEYIEKLILELGNDFCRRCGYCLPCTQGINIPSCFLFEGYYTRYNLKGWAALRYQTLEKTAKDCIECGKCLERCPYHLDIISKLKKVKEVFGK